ncbi:MAG: NADPH:quinone reductase-like Zn-dependent oxidoreductase [Paracoccaceae bacterium]|jgi:NADPH:quinone reductase-like Zn-dependent oxidoreductase
MKALVFDDYCGLDGMRIDEVADPVPGAGDVLVEVHAAGINPIDWKFRDGAMRARMDLNFPDVAGRDVSGVVTAIGADVTDLKPGDAVFGTCSPNRWGSHAELVAVDAGVVAIKPSNISHVEAASIALVGHTALTALERTATIEAGMRVLIHAGAGGVGAFAIQYCKSRGATVYATASAGNADYVIGLGADEAIDYTTTDFSDVLSDLDVVYDTVGGEAHLKSYKVLKPGGFLVCLNAAPVPDEKPRDDIKVETPMVGYDRTGTERIAALIAERAVQPSVGTVFFFSDAIDAYRLSETGHARGKIVLRMK